MIPKLKSRGSVDVPIRWQKGPSIVGLALLGLGGITGLALAGAAGLLATTHILLLVLGGAGVVAAMVAITLGAARSNL